MLCGPIPANTGETVERKRAANLPRAYPREHGGNASRIGRITPSGGLSPRTRGKPIITRAGHAQRGPIPANTGETCRTMGRSRAARAYPREHGGNWRGPRSGLAWEGLSPRTRGKRPRIARREIVFGPIPANTGETLPIYQSCVAYRAYPREHGGNGVIDFIDHWIGGLSPRTRGKPAMALSGSMTRGPIPANTGETVRLRIVVQLDRAYPREHGGNGCCDSDPAANPGLSPRTRGKLVIEVLGRAERGPIPANTGETVFRGRALASMRAYPREHGGNATVHNISTPERGLSPRTRGKHGMARLSWRRVRPIPANTGETLPSGPARAAYRAYPREHGGNWLYIARGLVCGGLSPRTRGKRGCVRPSRIIVGPIPANTGETDG